MRPLGFSLLASIVDASRLSERLFLSSLPGSLHVSLFSAVCVTPYPFPPFSLYHWPSHFMGFFFCHSDWCISNGFSGSVSLSHFLCRCLQVSLSFLSLSPKLSIWTHLSLSSISLCHFPPSIPPLFKMLFLHPSVAHF